MTDWQLVCLAVIAISVALMAAIQIGLIVVGIKLAKQASASMEELRKELHPLMEKVNRVADDVGRTTALAAAQVERVDRLFATTSVRVEEAVTIVQNAFGGPVRQGAAAIMVMRAVMSAFRQWKGGRGASGAKGKGAHHDGEDALFVG